MKQIRTLFTILTFILCLGAGVQCACALNRTAAYAAVENVETPETDSTDANDQSTTLQLGIFMAVILLISIVAVIVSISSVTVSLPIIEYFE